MKDNPDKKYVITGWADNYTGNSKINERLRWNRVNGVKKQLIHKGVPESQLDVKIDNANLGFFVSIMSSKTNRLQGLKVSLSPSNKQLKESAVSQYDLRNNIRVEIKAEAQLPSPGLARLLQIAAANGMSIRPLHSATPPNTPNNTLREQ